MDIYGDNGLRDGDIRNEKGYSCVIRRTRKSLYGSCEEEVSEMWESQEKVYRRTERCNEEKFGTTLH